MWKGQSNRWFSRSCCCCCCCRLSLVERAIFFPVIIFIAVAVVVVAVVGGSKVTEAVNEWAHLLGFFFLLLLLFLYSSICSSFITHTDTHTTLLPLDQSLWRCGSRFCLFVGCFLVFPTQKRRCETDELTAAAAAAVWRGRQWRPLVYKIWFVLVSLSVTSARAHSRRRRLRQLSPTEQNDRYTPHWKDIRRLLPHTDRQTLLPYE